MSTTDELRLRIEPAHTNTSVIQPLDTITLTLAGTGSKTGLTVTCEDSLKNAYLCAKNVSLARKGFSFAVKGSLGMHTLSLCKNNKLLVQKQFEVSAETDVKTGNVMYDTFFPRLKTFLINKEHAYYVNKQRVHIKGYDAGDQDWGIDFLRDYFYSVEGGKYINCEIKTEIDFFFANQRSDGTFYDYIIRDRTGMVPQEYYPVSMSIPEEKFFMPRITVEADVEYLAVMSVFLIWQATGDDKWMRSKLPAMDKALESYWKLPHRWSTEYNLVKRPFTIDTWDFEYGKRVKIGDKDYPRTNIDEHSKFGIMHGDNTGLASASALLARMYEYCDESEQAKHWLEKGREILDNLNKIAWNGSYYVHRVPIDKVEIEGVDQTKQLSLSNALAMMRNVLTHDQSVSIIKEYQKRGKALNAFADWISLDPPFPHMKFTNTDFLHPGVYINGGFFPFIGGALTYGAFENGFEKYALKNLATYYKLIEVSGDSYFDYSPDGSAPKRPMSPNDSWGPSLMSKAFIEGLVGVKDTGVRYSNVELAPRWPAANVHNAQAIIKYGASNGYFAYAYNVDAKKKTMTIETSGTAGETHFHVLIPAGVRVKRVTIDGKKTDFSIANVEKSLYVDFVACLPNVAASIDYE